jgi:hypothetical protein
MKIERTKSTVPGKYWCRGDTQPSPTSNVSLTLYFRVRLLLQRGKYEEAAPILVANPCLMSMEHVQSLFTYFACRCDAGTFLCMLKAWPASEFSIGHVLNKLVDADTNKPPASCREFYNSPAVVRLVLSLTDWNPAQIHLTMPPAGVESDRTTCLVPMLVAHHTPPGIVSMLFNGVAAIFARQTLLSLRKAGNAQVYVNAPHILSFLGYDTKQEQTCMVRSRYVAVDYVRGFLNGRCVSSSILKLGSEAGYARDVVLGSGYTATALSERLYSGRADPQLLRQVLNVMQELLHCGVNLHNKTRQGPFWTARDFKTGTSLLADRRVKCIQKLLTNSFVCPTCPFNGGTDACMNTAQSMWRVRKHLQIHAAEDSSLCVFYNPEEAGAYKGFVRGGFAANFFHAVRGKMPHWSCLEYFLRRTCPSANGWANNTATQLYKSVADKTKSPHGGHNLLILLLCLHMQKMSLHCGNGLMMQFIRNKQTDAVQLILDYLDKLPLLLPNKYFPARHAVRRHRRFFNPVIAAAEFLPLPVFARVANRYREKYSVWTLETAFCYQAEYRTILMQRLGYIEDNDEDE